MTHEYQKQNNTKQNVTLATPKQKEYIEMLKVNFDQQYVSYLQPQYKRNKE